MALKVTGQKAQDGARPFSFNLCIFTCFYLCSWLSRASPRLCLQGRQEAAAGSWEKHHSISKGIKKLPEKPEGKQHFISFGTGNS